jgi:hypothetical protein
MTRPVCTICKKSAWISRAGICIPCSEKLKPTEPIDDFLPLRPTISLEIPREKLLVCMKILEDFAIQNIGKMKTIEEHERVADASQVACYMRWRLEKSHDKGSPAVD